ncbi:MAG: hypothetical protein ABJF11_10295 [Reichenbachiella sp.]|uniref:hypothetical protein n=1 Tax=Reichenbachiella sp. TaxID=2184521 RepID=UPI0032679C32
MKELSRITVFTGILILICYCLLDLIGLSFVHPAVYQVIGFLWFLYTSIHITYLLAAKNPNIETAILPLVGLGLRFVVTLFTLMVWLMRNPADTELFVINFMVIYFAFVVFEITALLSNLRRNSSQDQNT